MSGDMGKVEAAVSALNARGVKVTVAEYLDRPVIKDLCCGGGGAAMGLAEAGWRVLGCDINPQPNYPFEFERSDVKEMTAQELRYGCSAAWASFPCQAFTRMQNMHGNQDAHEDLITPGRELLLESGLDYIMENVEGAPLRTDVMLCGSMFGLRIAKHRHFELNWPLFDLLPPCDHEDLYDPWHGAGRTADKFRQAQDTPWLPMAGGESRKQGRTGDLFNAIPPVFARYLGGKLLTHQSLRAVA